MYKYGAFWKQDAQEKNVYFALSWLSTWNIRYKEARAYKCVFWIKTYANLEY